MDIYGNVSLWFAGDTCIPWNAAAIFYNLLPIVQNLFSRLFSAMLSHNWMEVGSKLPYKELHIKFDFCHKIKTPLMEAAILAVLYLKVHWNKVCRFHFVGVGGGPVLLKQYSQYACVRLGKFQRLDWLYWTDCKVIPVYGMMMSF